MTPHYILDGKVAIPAVAGLHDLHALRNVDTYPQDEELRERLAPGEWFALQTEIRRLSQIYPRDACDGLERHYTRLAIADTVARACCVVAPSARTRDDIVTAFPHAAERVAIVRPFPAGHLYEAATVPALHRKPPYVLHVARFRPHKNHAMIVAAAGVLTHRSRHMSGGQIVFAGLGSENERALLRGMIAEAGVTDTCAIVAELAAPEFASLLSRAAAVISASSDEGFDLPSADAIVADVPIVARSVPPALESFPGAAAYFADPQTLAHAISEAFARRLRPPSARVPHLREKIESLRGDLGTVIQRWL